MNPKIDRIDRVQQADGILLPESYKTHWLTEDEQAGEHITNVALSNVSFVSDLDTAYFDVPEGAQLLEGL